MTLKAPRLVRAAVQAGAILAAGGTASGAPEPSPRSALATPVPPSAIGRRALGLRYFRLDPASADTVFRLLVVPVRFPEDGSLGETAAGLAARLTAQGTGSLAGYWLAATRGRLRLEVTVAPEVVARHERTYYTVEGGGNFGYGTDPAAYPHNAQSLVEEVASAEVDRVDFRRFDNTGDGIVDGLLVLHSGPRSTEDDPGALPPSVLLAHAFTLPAPLALGGSTVFPYAIASARDGVGVWAHEYGHLLGLPDLYVSNGLCPGDGVGEWSLMATGANRDGGNDPSGLDPFCRQLLGETATPPSIDPVDLAGGAFIRVHAPGDAAGPRYFLVERRTGDDGLGLDAPGFVVYAVDETKVDNRSCVSFPDLPRNLVSVRSVVCPGAGACDAVLDDSTDPPLTDADGTPTRLVLTFSGTSVSARHDLPAPLRLERASLARPSPPNGGGDPVQRLRLGIRNLDPAASHQATVSIPGGWSGPAGLCLTDLAGLVLTVPPGGSVTDSSIAFAPCQAGAPLPAGEARLAIRVIADGTLASPLDTLTFVTEIDTLGGGVMGRFTAMNRSPGRALPWHPVPGFPADTTSWRAASFDRFADGELVGPWFTVPPDGRLILAHAWNLDALSPDLALDGGQVRLRRQLLPDAILVPPLGWGYTAERGTGNPLGGTEVLSGEGSRTHVFDLSPYAGETVRLVFRASGDVDPGTGEWDLGSIDVRPAPAVRFALAAGPADSGGVIARSVGESGTGVSLTLFGGDLATSPVDTVGGGAWSGEAAIPFHPAGEGRRRFELVWTTPDGAADATASILDLPLEDGFASALLPPVPNPLRTGETQTWSIFLPAAGRPGTYRLRLLDPRGRRVVDRPLRIDVPGIRLVTWDGRDVAGRPVPAGVYFLEVRRPDGGRDSRQIVVLH